MPWCEHLQELFAIGTAVSRDKICTDKSCKQKLCDDKSIDPSYIILNNINALISYMESTR